MTFDNCDLLASGRVPEPNVRSSLAVARSWRPLIVSGHIPIDPAMVASQNGTRTGCLGARPPAEVRGVGAVAVAGNSKLESLSNAERRSPVSAGSREGLGSEADRLLAASGGGGGGIVRSEDQARQFGVEQVGLVGQQVVDESGSVAVTWQGPQQVGCDVSQC